LQVPITSYGGPDIEVPAVPSERIVPSFPQIISTNNDLNPESKAELLGPEDEAGMVIKSTESSITETVTTTLSPESKTGGGEKLFDLDSETEMSTVISNEENAESFTTTESIGTTTDLLHFKPNEFSTSENEMIDILYGSQQPEQNTEKVELVNSDPKPTQRIRPSIKQVVIVDESNLMKPELNDENMEKTTSSTITFLDEIENNISEPRQLDDEGVNTNYGAPISNESSSRPNKDPEVQNPSKPETSNGAPNIQISPSSSEPSTVYGAPVKIKLPETNLEISYGSPDIESVTEMLHGPQRSVDDSNPESLLEEQDLQLKLEVTTPAQSNEETTPVLDFEKNNVGTNRTTTDQILAKDNLNGPDLRTESADKISSGYDVPQLESNSVPSTLYKSPERKPEQRSEDLSGQQPLPFYVTPKSKKMESTYVKPEVVKRIIPASASRGRKLNPKNSKPTNSYVSPNLFPEPEVVDIKLDISN